MRERITALVLCSLSAAALADQKKPAKVDPEADELLHRMSDSDRIGAIADATLYYNGPNVVYVVAR